MIEITYEALDGTSNSAIMINIYLGKCSYSKRTNRFASALQNSHPRKKLTSTTFLFAPLDSSSVPMEILELEDVPSAAYRYLRTSQLEVAPRIDDTRVREDSRWSDR
jgi:hypothetical protein